MQVAASISIAPVSCRLLIERLTNSISTGKTSADDWYAPVADQAAGARHAEPGASAY
ncbi:hypothetical protein [Burkholderia ubonensis]|uniref:hypothetical protein n=1 Tax=Burkholderia ubonensis TaxID=101571 RepID=UPI0012FE1A8D|nr:hypothetical protein [Burkholderia ubonensis]